MLSVLVALFDTVLGSDVGGGIALSGEDSPFSINQTGQFE